MTYSPSLSFLALGLCLVSAPAQAQEGGEAAIETGVSYSSQRGGLAFVGLTAQDLMGSGLNADISYRAGEDGEGLAADIGWRRALGDTALGQDSFLRLGLFGQKSDWSSDAYTLETYGADLRLGAETAGGLRYAGRLFWQQDTLDDFADSISPLAAVPLDQSQVVGIGAEIGYNTLTGRGPLATGFAVSGSVNLATPLGDREWVSTEASASYTLGLGRGMVLALGGDAGQIAGRGGDEVVIVDRAFLSNPLPRGFAYGGIGPRDVVAGSVDTALGGNRFVTSSVELRVPTGSPNLTVAGFVDAGALWELDTVAGGASGTIDDSYFLRTSVGVAAYWETPLGLLQINLAKPTQSRETDVAENLSIDFGFQF